MTDLLEAGARRSLPAWTSPATLLVAALCLAVWTVVHALPPTVDGHGSRPESPAHVQYQPVLGRPIF